MTALLRARAGLAVAVLCLSGPASAMTAEELFNDGNRLFRDDLYWAALLRYGQAAEAGMSGPLLDYNTGVAHYRAGQHVRAREHLLRAADSPGLRVVAHYNLGLNAWKLGETEEALRWLRLARDQQGNPRIAEYAREAIARIRANEQSEDPIVVEEERRQREAEFAHLELRGTMSFGNDDNVFRSADTPYIDYSDPAQPVVTPEVISGAVMPYSLSAKYRVNAYEHEGFFGAYRLAGRYYPDTELENANEFVHELSFGSEYSRLNEDKGRTREVFSAFTIAQHDQVYYDPDDGSARNVDGDLIDERMNYLRYGPELSFRQSHERLAFGLDVTGQLWNYTDTELVPEYDHEYFIVNLYTQYAFTSTSLLRVAGAWSSRRYGDRRAYNTDGEQLPANETLRYDYLDLSLEARQRITRKMWFGVEYRRTDRTDEFEGYNDYIRDQYGVRFYWQLGYRFNLQAHGVYHLYNYPRAFAFNDPALPRKTLERLDVSLEASYRMTRHLYLVLSADHFEKVSNDTRIAYDRNLFALGVRWSQ